MYYHPSHGRNVDLMLDAMGAALTYGRQHLSEYRAKHLRIAEFVGFKNFATASPDLLAFAETAGFRFDRDPSDALFAAVAHETTRGLELISADVPGSPFLVESLAEFTTLMLLEKERGSKAVRRYLKRNTRTYLLARARDESPEPPLRLVEEQGYLRYQKGGHAMYALRAYIGADAVHRALATLLRRAHAGSRYVVFEDLYRELQAVTPPEYRPLLDDLLARVVIFDSQITDTRAAGVADNAFRLDITAELRRFVINEHGRERPSAMPTPVLIRVFGQHDRILYRKVHTIERETHLSIDADARPSRVDTAPNHWLIDRNISNNSMNIRIGQRAQP